MIPGFFMGDEGAGCHHCVPGVPIERIETRHGTVALCLECVLRWFPGKDVHWWEDRHAPFLDHVKERFKRERQRHQRWFEEQRRKGLFPAGARMANT